MVALLGVLSFLLFLGGGYSLCSHFFFFTGEEIERYENHYVEVVCLLC